MSISDSPSQLSAWASSESVILSDSADGVVAGDGADVSAGYFYWEVVYRAKSEL